MNRKQDSISNMLLVLRDFLNANANITAKLPNFALFFTALLNAIKLIQKYSTQQILDRSGLYQNKIQLRKVLVQLSADVSRKIQAYAEFASNLILAAETKFTETELSDAGDNKLRDISQSLYDHVEIHLTALAPYGLTEDTQKDYLALIKEFDAAIPKPKLGTTIGKQNTSELSKAFSDAEAAIYKIDKVVEIVRQSEPIFYMGYKSASKVLYGSPCLSVKGKITEASNGLPIRNVTVMFYVDNGTIPSPKDKPVRVKKSALKGGFFIRSMPAGMYKVVIRKNGYAEQVLTISITDGETTELIIEMKGI